MKNRLLNRVAKFCFYLFFAFLPFGIGTFLFTPELYPSGLFNPYTGYFFHISELFLLAGLLFFFSDLLLDPKGRTSFSFKKVSGLLKTDAVFLLLLIFILIVFLSALFSVNVGNTLLYGIRLVEIAAVYLLFSFRILDFKRVFGIFVGVMFLQSILALLQYYAQGSIGLYFLGEPVLDASAKGVASVDFGDEKVIRPYGTFPHPNVLGMYAVFAFWFLVYLSNRIKDKLVLVSLGFLFLSVLVLSFSRSAWLAFCLSGFVYVLFRGGKSYLKYIVCFAGLFLLAIYASGVGETFLYRFGILSDGVAFFERLRLMDVSIKMLLDNPFGVGFGNFTIVMQDYDHLKLFPWNYQPVHNIFLLSFAETGWIGGFSFIALIGVALWKAVNLKKVFLPVVLGVCVFSAGLFDHYFLTLFQGQVLLVLFLSLIMRE